MMYMHAVGGVVGVVNPTEPLLSPLFVITESDSNQNVSFCLELLSGGQLGRDLPVCVDISMNNGTGKCPTTLCAYSNSELSSTCSKWKH